MNVHLTPELKALVDAKVGTGRYTSASEVVREALRLMEERDRYSEQKLARLRADIACGLEEAKRGASIPLDESAVEAIKRSGRKRLGAGRG